MDDAEKSLIRQKMQKLVATARGMPPPKDQAHLDQRPAAPIEEPAPSDSVRPGKIAISLRLDADVLEILRGSGRGWQTRVNAHLRHAVGLDRGAPGPVDLRRKTD